MSFALCFLSCKDDIFLVTDFGAIPDGKTLSTQSIQEAIDKAIAVKGTVVFSKGTFYSGSLTLGPDITIVFEEDATLLASNNISDYTQNEFILAPYAHNLMIKGKGTINGNGLSFFDDNWNFTERPQPWIDIKDAKNVTVEGITLTNSPSHTLSFSYCDGVEVKGISIKNDPKSPNTDGIDIRNSVNVKISACDIRTGDDAICIKNGRSIASLTNTKGEKRSQITQDVNVTNCYLESDDAALKLGTGSGYLTRNITFDSIKIKHTRYAIALFNMDGGRYENVTFSNIDAETGGRHKQQYPIFIDVHTRNEDGNPGDISGISFHDSRFKTNGIVYISGHPQQTIDSISFKNVTFLFTNRLDNSAWQKPKGNKRIKRWETAGDYVQTKADMLIAHADAVTFNDVVLKQDSIVQTNFQLIDAKVDTIAIVIKNSNQKKPKK
ncbi:glycoside hydrolase family 28 protein [Winogradskyella sp.]|uniref:glycoside hydrolase family 28 protein n=1 Tax=Winogradskyella sp. TaxID=1883156 RepID=UPI003BAB8049